ncbi:hypothetical protein FZI91_03095 [Mycobacterium sp. CBMA271]|uniref:hypothetical protein n=1 Tax=unclassified Mycobacteroides TaxID=2618759 RepID=UPI0012DFC300|nr:MULTISPECIES: hypothetical protein [unclassified Mycobacteroides]MUM16363.1 hypothetical protein [Mycobacteroides sp. CBMA 326]MUM20693.1 hypothetical protein [Mycobacteroides sp. CBMA 271]
MKAPDTDFYLAVMAAVSGGILILIEPDGSSRQKWLYWAVAPMVAAICTALATTSIPLSLGAGVAVLFLAAVGYLRYKT